MNKIISIFILLFISLPSFAIERDYFVEKTLASNVYAKPYTNLNYNYESLECVPIKLQITKNISTKKDEIFEGQKINFKVREDVFYDNKIILKKGTIVTAEVEIYITRGMNGIPATIIVDNFDIPDIPREKLKSIYIKKGANRTIFVLPFKWALTPLPPTGSFTNIIIGGHAKITQKDKITIYYFPKWGSELPDDNIDIIKL